MAGLDSPGTYFNRLKDLIQQSPPSVKRNWLTAARVFYDSANYVFRKVCEIERAKGLELPDASVLKGEDFTDLAKLLTDSKSRIEKKQCGSFFKDLGQGELKQLEEKYNHSDGSKRNVVLLNLAVDSDNWLPGVEHVFCIDQGKVFSLMRLESSRYYQEKGRDKKACKVSVYCPTDAWYAVQDLRDMRNRIIGHPNSADLSNDGIQKVFDAVKRAYNKLIIVTEISEEDAYKEFNQIMTKHESCVDGTLKKLEEEVKKLLENDKSIFRDWVKDKQFTKLKEEGEENLKQDLKEEHQPSEGATDVDPNAAKDSLVAEVTIKITNIGVHGYPGTGKTSVLDLAMGKPPADTRTSTDCIEPPDRYMMTGSEDSSGELSIHWEPVEMEKMVYGAMKKVIDEAPRDLAQSDKSFAATANKSKAPNVTKYSTTVADEQVPSASDVEPDLSPLSSTSDYSWFPELLHELKRCNKSGVIFNSHLIFISDCGGQPPFLDVSALFPQNSSLTIFPLKLNESLYQKAEFSYYANDVPATLNETHIMTTHYQAIEALAKSVASTQPPSLLCCRKQAAKFTIVGTFNDEEIMEDRETLLKDLLKPDCTKFLVQGTEIILPVNAITQNEAERKELTKQLQDLIFEEADVTMSITVKLNTFVFYLQLLAIAKKEKKAVLTLGECYKIGDKLSMDESETKNAIQFFHGINLIMYFDDEMNSDLRNSVVVRTKAVLKSVSRLISVSFLNRTFLRKHLQIKISEDVKTLLQCQGLFVVETLKACLNPKEPEIAVELLLSILEHVKVITAIKGASCYFMPCALPYAPEDELCKFCSSDPWVIRLKRKGPLVGKIPIPFGYLPTLVIFLLAQNEDFSFNRDKPEQYRNAIRLEYNRRSVYFVERRCQIEVSLSRCEYSLNDRSDIRNVVLQKAIPQTEERLHIEKDAITKDELFLCSCDGCNDRHFCILVNTDNPYLMCEETEHTFEMKSSWLSPGKNHPEDVDHDDLVHSPPAKKFRPDTNTLPDVEVLPEIDLQYSGDVWEGCGLKLHVKEGSTARFKARVVYSTKFLLPEGTQLVSPIFWVTSVGETSGPVSVEIQHCVDIKTDEGLSGLGIAVYKVEKSEQSYQFNKADGHFSYDSRYGKIELEFSGWFFAIIRMLNLYSEQIILFHARLYYYNRSQSDCTAYLVIVPDVDTCQQLVQKEYGNYVPGVSVKFFIMEDNLRLSLEGVGALKCNNTINVSGWGITPMNDTRVSMNIFNYYNSISPYVLDLKWRHHGREPNELKVKIIISGSEGLVLHQPTAQIAPSTSTGLTQPTVALESSASAATPDKRPMYPMEQMKEIVKGCPLLRPSDKEKIRKFAADNVIVLIQSCNEAEFCAALHKIEASTEFGQRVRYPDNHHIVVGTFAGWNAAIVQTRQGNDCRYDLKEILGFFPKTKYLLGLGVCMGIKKKLGDVLIGKKLQIESIPKLENGKFRLRGTCEDVKGELNLVFFSNRVCAYGWNFECTAEGCTSKVYQGCIFSSPLLINDRIVKKGLEGESQELIGAEMEGWVLFTEFKHINSIIIKGVCDYGDGTKEKSWQLTAAKAAVDYAHFILKDAYL